MDDTAPSPAQADCLTAFAALRDGADTDPETTIELGEGCNRFPPSPDLARYLSALLDRFIRDGTLSAYSGRHPASTRGAMAELLGSHLNMHLDASDIFFTRGGTEAISLTIAHLAATGHGLVMPLPNYYAFDQAAFRWGAPVTAYYRHDGALHHTGAVSTSGACLVEVLPNGVTGARHVPLKQARPDFTLIDVPFQVGTEGPQPAAVLRDRVQDLDLETAALILTASKDLSLPGLRAAIVVTRNKALLRHLGSDRFERMAMTGDPIGEIAMLFYVSLLAVADAPSEQTGKLVQIAQDCAHRANLPALPDEETYRRVRGHLTSMSERFRRNALALADPRSPLRPITGLEPATGYSTFAELRAPQEDFLDWVARCGRSGLQLNPTVVHGGTSMAWEALYPGGQLLRINLSEAPVTFDRGLSLLRRYATNQFEQELEARGQASPEQVDADR
ncbi:aminotransferase class I/II-fold pyridoxal phosphate-dependent enzyme [Streptomyces sp. NPDC048659]|uniref:aminotransferase class I/II-fold pyridoxal phosphate-dependent enzyme n=1 Tax=Streptomyces sp. NPDC048659 TaxID=3155489 RepID=UPI00341EC9A7